MAGCDAFGMQDSGKERKSMEGLKKRAGVYRLLGLLYREEISSQTWELLKKSGIFVDNDAVDDSFAVDKSPNALTVLAVDYARVFLAAGMNDGHGAFPYESVYTSKKHIVMQDAWEQVRVIYTKSGFALGRVPSDVLEDHIAAELEYMSQLCRMGASEKEQMDFLKNHLLNWVGRFCADVKKYAHTQFYKKLAEMTENFLNCEAKFLEAYAS